MEHRNTTTSDCDSWFDSLIQTANKRVHGTATPPVTLGVGIYAIRRDVPRFVGVPAQDDDIRGDLIHLAIAGDETDALPFGIHHEKRAISPKADCGLRELVLLAAAAKVLKRHVI